MVVHGVDRTPDAPPRGLVTLARMPAGRRLVLAVLMGVAAGALGGCAEGTVRVAFQPAPGARSTYRIEVRAVAVTSIRGEAPRRTVADTVLVARHQVLDSGPDGSRVRVRLTEEGGPTSTFVVRLDRGAQLTAVQRIEGLPAGALGDLGLSEIFPAGATAPPDRALAPGDRWSIDAPVRVAAPGAGASQVTGRGRLVALQATGGRELARVDSTYRLPVHRTADDTGGQLVLDGSQRTRATVAYDLDDGSVRTATARTRGRYEVTLLPPPGVAGSPVPGTLVVDVDSTTRRTA